MILTGCLLTTSTRIASSKLMEMLRSFGTNDIAIGWFHPLRKVVRPTAMLNNVLVLVGGVNNGFRDI